MTMNGDPQTLDRPSVLLIPTGGDRNLGYVVADPDRREAMAVDPSYAPERLVDAAAKEGWRFVLAFCTHRHSDHTNGNRQFESLTNVRPLLFGDSVPDRGGAVSDGAVFPLGRLSVRILHTPGHSPDSICLLVGDALFTGDTLFVGKVGGTGSRDDARQEYASLHDRLLALPPTTRVFPGHDVGVRPESTLAQEAVTNPFLLQPDFESFFHLKETWADYKKRHGIA
jgi:hydroxyacylglutathione hydrolase